jgi:uncharacterized protein DUF5681
MLTKCVYLVGGYRAVTSRTLREPVIIVENGKRKTVTKIEAAIKQLVNQAASGKLKALQLLATLVRSAEERGIQAAAPNSSGGGTKINLVSVNIDKSDRPAARGNVPGPPWKTS